MWQKIKTQIFWIFCPLDGADCSLSAEIRKNSETVSLIAVLSTLKYRDSIVSRVLRQIPLIVHTPLIWLNHVWASLGLRQNGERWATVWFAASVSLATFTCPYEESCHTPAARSSGEKHQHQKCIVFGYYTCSAACFGQLAQHPEATGDQEEEKGKNRWLSCRCDKVINRGLKIGHLQLHCQPGSRWFLSNLFFLPHSKKLSSKGYWLCNNCIPRSPTSLRMPTTCRFPPTR